MEEGGSGTGKAVLFCSGDLSVCKTYVRSVGSLGEADVTDREES